MRSNMGFSKCAREKLIIQSGTQRLKNICPQPGKHSTRRSKYVGSFWRKCETLYTTVSPASAISKGLAAHCPERVIWMHASHSRAVTHLSAARPSPPPRGFDFGNRGKLPSSQPGAGKFIPGHGVIENGASRRGRGAGGGEQAFRRRDSRRHRCTRS